jgi:heme/copper-type cytochrome/quinol oxidase subunit 2
MRLIALEVCVGVATLVFVTMLTATALHRFKGGADGIHRRAALAEYLWTVIPWLMMAASAAPAVRWILVRE